MKLDVYKEQYRSKQAHHEAGKIGFGPVGNALTGETIAGLGNTLLKATDTMLEQRDALNSARIEADTILAADKMYRDFQETADPDNFEGDMETQRQSIQNLISQSSKKFLLPKSQMAFQEKMTRGLEEKYIGNALQYSYAIQQEKYQDLAKSAADKYKPLLLNGSDLITVPEVMQEIHNYYTTIGHQYHIPQALIDDHIKKQNTSIVASYTYGMLPKNPQLIRDLLVGQDFSKFKDYKKSLGQDFTMEEFWQSDDLKSEYAQSEFGANWTNLEDYLDYDTRISLLKLADGELDKQQKEALKTKILQNSKSDYEIDTNIRAIKDQIELNGSYPTEAFQVVTLGISDDPELGSKNSSIVMGEAKKGPLSTGHSITKNGQTFANGLDGNLRSKGYITYITSNLRPEDTGSQHKDGSAVDIQVFGKNGAWSEQGAIDAYAAAVALYGNKMRKGGTLFEVDPSRLDYIKKALEDRGVDTSYVNWTQSKTWGAKAKAPHIHFGIDKNGNYSKTDSGLGQEIKLIGPAADKYKQQRAAGKSVQEAYDAGKKVQLELYAALNKYQLKQRMLTTKGSDGKLLSPSEYGAWLVNETTATTSGKKLTAEERVIRLEALQQLKTDIPTMQQTYVDDPVKFIQQNFPQQATSKENIAGIQGAYGISGDNLVNMNKDEANTVAAKLENMSIDQAIVEVSKYSQRDLEQIQSQASEGSKLGVILYSHYASPALKGDILKLGPEWQNVQNAIANDKNKFPTNWQDKLISAINSNSIMKGYFQDIEKTNPQEKAKILNAMMSMGAYKKYTGTADDKAIAKYLAENLIANNFNTVTINNPRWGNTTMNISNKAFNSTQAAQIKQVSNVLAKMGLKPQTLYGAQIVYPNGTLQEVKTQEAINAKHNIDGMLKTAKLSSDARGLNLVFTRSDPQSMTAGTTIKLKNGKTISVSFKELCNIYNQASSLAGHWKVDKGMYFVPGEYTKVSGMSDVRAIDTPKASGVSHAMDVAIQYIISNRQDFYWVNPTVKEFSRSKIEIKGVNYDIKYDKYGKEISKVKSKTQPPKTYKNNTIDPFRG